MIFSTELFFYQSKNYSFIYTGLFENLKARFLKSIITWSEMGQQTVQAKELYCLVCRPYLFTLLKVLRRLLGIGFGFTKVCDWPSSVIGM